jgi:multiple sugar transport system permease protein
MFKETARVVILGVFFLFLLFPLFWIVSFSFKQEVDITAYPPKFVFKPTLQNYISSITGKTKASTGIFYQTKPKLPLYLKNTLVLTVGSLLLTILIGIPASYSLAKLRVKGKQQLSFMFLSFRFLPELAVILPIYVMYNRLKLIDTYHGLIWVYQLITLPLFVLIMHSFFQDIPQDIIEAAYVDGATPVKTLVRVVLPLCGPGIAAASILCFIFAWNTFQFALILGANRTQPITIGLLTFISFQEIQRGSMAAVATIGVIPSVVFAVLSHKFIVRGLTLGALKE